MNAPATRRRTVRNIQNQVYIPVLVNLLPLYCLYCCDHRCSLCIRKALYGYSFLSRCRSFSETLEEMGCQSTESRNTHVSICGDFAFCHCDRDLHCGASILLSVATCFTYFTRTISTNKVVRSILTGCKGFVLHKRYFSSADVR